MVTLRAKDCQVPHGRPCDHNISLILDVMHIGHEPDRGRLQFSLKDHILLIIMGASALLGFALSFSLLQPNGRPYLFSGCVAVYLTCIVFATKRRALVLGTLVFIAIRVIWSVAITAAQRGNSLGHH